MTRRTQLEPVVVLDDGHTFTSEAQYFAYLSQKTGRNRDTFLRWKKRGVPLRQMEAYSATRPFLNYKRSKTLLVVLRGEPYPSATTACADIAKRHGCSTGAVRAWYTIQKKKRPDTTMDEVDQHFAGKPPVRFALRPAAAAALVVAAPPGKSRRSIPVALRGIDYPNVKTASAVLAKSYGRSPAAIAFLFGERCKTDARFTMDDVDEYLAEKHRAPKAPVVARAGERRKRKESRESNVTLGEKTFGSPAALCHHLSLRYGVSPKTIGGIYREAAAPKTFERLDAFVALKAGKGSVTYNGMTYSRLGPLMTAIAADEACSRRAVYCELRRHLGDVDAALKALSRASCSTGDTLQEWQGRNYSTWVALARDMKARTQSSRDIKAVAELVRLQGPDEAFRRLQARPAPTRRKIRAPKADRTFWAFGWKWASRSTFLRYYFGKSVSVPSDLADLPTEPFLREFMVKLVQHWTYSADVLDDRLRRPKEIEASMSKRLLPLNANADWQEPVNKLERSFIPACGGFWRAKAIEEREKRTSKAIRMRALHEQQPREAG